MAVPAGDERDWKFAKTFGLTIPPIFEGKDTDEEVFTGDRRRGHSHVIFSQLVGV